MIDFLQGCWQLSSSVIADIKQSAEYQNPTQALYQYSLADVINAKCDHGINLLFNGSYFHEELNNKSCYIHHSNIKNPKGRIILAKNKAILLHDKIDIYQNKTTYSDFIIPVNDYTIVRVINKFKQNVPTNRSILIFNRN